MSGQSVGYIRVSSLLQNTDRQLDGVQLDRVFEDRISGKDQERPQLQACLDHLRKGDVLHVHSIDRLARNLKDLQEIVDSLVAKGVTVHFHKENLFFTGEDSPMQKLMLQLMGAFAEFERRLINERQREGFAIAKRKGVHIGRPIKITSDRIEGMRKAVAAGQSKAAVAKDYKVSRQTVYTVLAKKA